MEVGIDEQDVAAFKKLMKMMKKTQLKTSILYSTNVKLNGQE